MLESLANALTEQLAAAEGPDPGEEHPLDHEMARDITVLLRIHARWRRCTSQ
jgi:hypothetical protein